MEDHFDLKVKEEDNCIIFYTSGYINNQAGELIARRCFEYIDMGENHFVINMENSNMINSIGISKLIEIIKRLMEGKGSLSFCNLTPTIAKTFNIMGLTQYAKIYPREEDAIQQIAASN
jgi:anti-anti-sigma factor